MRRILEWTIQLSRKASIPPAPTAIAVRSPIDRHLGALTLRTLPRGRRSLSASGGAIAGAPDAPKWKVQHEAERWKRQGATYTTFPSQLQKPRLTTRGGAFLELLRGLAWPKREDQGLKGSSTGSRAARGLR